MTNDLLIDFLVQTNEVLTAATVIVAVSMLLYNLTHGPRDRVAQASSVLLGCVSIIYMGDVFVSLTRDGSSAETWLRFEWLGIGLTPAALFHLSDSLLSTTGQRSRGRRRRVVRLLYLIGATFAFSALFTDLVVHSLVMQPLALMQAGGMFTLYVIFFVLAAGFSFNNVLRARRRCLTRATRRRMTYLLFALITPIAGIFPYSLLFTRPSEASPLSLWLLINLGNFGIVLMLTFMAYPLSFFGPKKPDRAIKAELLSFMLRGPVTGVAVLVAIMFVPRLSGIGIPGPTIMPFVAVATVLSLQWSFTIVIPFLERKLIYTGDEESMGRIRELGEHLLTPVDAAQLLESNLAALCDYLRVPSAFVVSTWGEAPRVEQTVGTLAPTAEQFAAPAFLALSRNGAPPESETSSGAPAALLVPWQSFWLTRLYDSRGTGKHPLGLLGIWARSPAPDLMVEEEGVFRALCGRITRVLNDIRVQEELFSRMEDVLQETESAQTSAELRLNYTGEVAQLAAQTRSALIDQPDFPEMIREALRNYWGGSRLSDDRFLQLISVQRLLPENEDNPTKAVRALLNRAAERLKPEGQRSMILPEWTLYNIIDLRFFQGKKVADVAGQLARGEADIYRKQRVAIEQMVQQIIEMERQAAGSTPSPASAANV